MYVSDWRATPWFLKTLPETNDLSVSYEGSVPGQKWKESVGLVIQLVKWLTDQHPIY